MSVRGILADDALQDFTHLGAAHSAAMEVTFELFASDFAFDARCTVRYDLSLPGVLEPGNPDFWRSFYGIDTYVAWLVDLAPGTTDCPPRQQHQGFEIEQRVRSQIEGLALGPMSPSLAAELEAAVGSEAWASTWAPNVFSVYLHQVILEEPYFMVMEIGYARAYEAECADIPLEDGRATPVPVAELPRQGIFVQGLPTLAITFEHQPIPTGRRAALDAPETARSSATEEQP